MVNEGTQHIIVDEEGGRIFLTGELEADALSVALHALLLMDQQELNVIQLWINSPGGDGLSAMALADVILTLETAVVTVAWGNVASAATMIFQAGDYRQVMPTTTMMVHAGGWCADLQFNQATAPEMRQEAHELVVRSKVVEWLDRLHAKQMGDLLIPDTGTLRLVGGKEIVKQGWADGIYGDDD